MKFIAAIVFILLVVVVLSLGYTYLWCDIRPCHEYCTQHSVWGATMKNKCQRAQVYINQGVC